MCIMPDLTLCILMGLSPSPAKDFQDLGHIPGMHIADMADNTSDQGWSLAV